MNTTIDYNIQASIFGSTFSIFWILITYPCFWRFIDLRGEYAFCTLIINILVYSISIIILSSIFSGIILSFFNLWPYASTFLWIIGTVFVITFFFLTYKIHEYNVNETRGDSYSEQQDLMCDRCFKYNDCTCCDCCS